MSAPAITSASAPAITSASAPAIASASAQASDEAIDITPITSSQLLEGLEDQIRKFSGISGLRSAVNTLSKHLYQATDTTKNQYLVFRPVTENDLAEIEDKRHTIHRGLRFTYCTDIDTLIIKVPSSEHEAVTRTFSYDFMDQISSMGLTELGDLKAMGATAYKGTSTSKEPDACWRPLAARPNKLGWPTLVFEVGVTETLNKLKADAKCWLANSRGRVKIVLLIKVDRVARTIHIEKWECRPAAHAYANRPPAQIPTQIQSFDINAHGVVTGDPPPLVLHFRNLLLRQPVPPQEQDVRYTRQHLQRLAIGIWAALQ